MGQLEQEVLVFGFRHGGIDIIRGVWTMGLIFTFGLGSSVRVVLDVRFVV